MAGNSELVAALMRRADEQKDPMLLAAAERLIGCERLLRTVNSHGHTVMWQKAVRDWLGGHSLPKIFNNLSSKTT